MPAHDATPGAGDRRVGGTPWHVFYEKKIMDYVFRNWQTISVTTDDGLAETLLLKNSKISEVLFPLTKLLTLLQMYTSLHTM